MYDKLFLTSRQHPQNARDGIGKNALPCLDQPIKMSREKTVDRDMELQISGSVVKGHDVISHSNNFDDTKNSRFHARVKQDIFRQKQRTAPSIQPKKKRVVKTERVVPPLVKPIVVTSPSLKSLPLSKPGVSIVETPTAAAERARLSVPAHAASPRTKFRRSSTRFQAEKILVHRLAFGEEEDVDRPSAQGDIDMYTDENLRLRELLRWDSKMLKVLGKWWFACLVDFDRNRNGLIEKGEQCRYNA